MTVARNSQAVLEVLRTNTAVKAQASQVAFEVLRTFFITARSSQMVLEVLRVNGAETPLGGTTRPQLIVVC